jgi:hypothetical protein
LGTEKTEKEAEKTTAQTEFDTAEANRQTFANEQGDAYSMDAFDPNGQTGPMHDDEAAEEAANAAGSSGSDQGGNAGGAPQAPPSSD